jgi:hypothetical protein
MTSTGPATHPQYPAPVENGHRSVECARRKLTDPQLTLTGGMAAVSTKIATHKIFTFPDYCCFWVTLLSIGLLL